MYLVISTIARLLSRLSFPTLESLSRMLTFVFFDVFRLRRRLMLKNLRIAFEDKHSEAQNVAIARAATFNFVQTIFEALISRHVPIDAHVDVSQGEHMQNALAQGRGAYILCFHMGNWEAMGAAVTHKFRPAYTAMKKVGSKGVNRFVEEMREANGMYWIKREKKGDAFRQMLAILDRGDIVGLVMDQARPGEPRLPFFSKDAKTNTSLAAIWQKRQAPVVPAYIYRKKFGHHVLEFAPPLEPQDGEDKKASTIQNSLLFTSAVEKAVRKYPEHYFWFHNRWK